ncbi:TRAP transporter substrate-binding protein [Shinella sedimenti]|uniref:TRAP transporter substrate-binding protein n=1 Tax=Shinella sedimenti TaxID=2919913 RepID=A0ABT0CTX9_9HYPH|nr:TRAP transporter substrate-binding protein [Shinella sedimenti]MCJ8152073.1 TRAP transporter substrate-binding protein [Shinella sedimenti]
MKLSRRLFIGVGVGALAAPALVAGKAQAAEFRFKFANNFPLGHPMNNRMTEARDRIAEETDGRFMLQIFPNNQLGSDTDTLNQVRSGAVEFFTLSGIILSSLVPVASINGMGFAFKDTGQVWQAMDGELGAYVRDKIKASRLHVMDHIFNNGFRQITTSTGPIEGPGSLRNLKIRVPVSPLWTSMFQALGCAPASINWNEVYTALQSGIVDAQENPLSTIDVGKLFEVQKYCSLTNHMWDGFWMLANPRSWDRLPDDIKEIVSRNFAKSTLDQRADIDKLNETLRVSLEGHGMQFNEPDPEAIRNQLREANFYSEWKANYGEEAWELLEKVTGPLA